MGWFGAGKSKKASAEELALPELPELPSISEDYGGDSSHQLPVLPSNDFGEKFSQNRIKDAITKEKDDEELDLPELPRERVPISGSLKNPPVQERVSEEECVPSFTREVIEERGKHIERGKFNSSTSKKQDPVFIRIDKYQESLEVFEKTREKLAEVEDLFKRSKLLKEEEAKQIEEWERQIQEIREHVQKIDKEMFSKIE